MGSRGPADSHHGPLGAAGWCETPAWEERVSGQQPVGTRDVTGMRSLECPAGTANFERQERAPCKLFGALNAMQRPSPTLGHLLGLCGNIDMEILVCNNILAFSYPPKNPQRSSAFESTRVCESRRLQPWAPSPHWAPGLRWSPGSCGFMRS